MMVLNNWCTIIKRVEEPLKTDHQPAGFLHFNQIICRGIK